MVVWYTPSEEGEEADAAVFLSIGTARPVLLLPEEAAVLVTLLPGLRDLAGPTLRQLAAEAEQSNDPTSVRVWPLPSPYAGQAQNPRNRRLGRIMTEVLMLLPGAVVAFLLPGGTWLMWKFAVANNVLPNWSLVVYVLAVGFSCVELLRWWYRPGQTVPLMLRTRYIYGLLRRAVAARPQPLVPADDPRAVFAEMSPRRLWSGTKSKCGDYNQGLLLVDSERRGILFEGDYERVLDPGRRDSVLRGRGAVRGGRNHGLGLGRRAACPPGQRQLGVSVFPHHQH